MRLIDADAIPYCMDDVGSKSFDYVRRRTIDAMPTIAAEPVKQSINEFCEYQIEWLTAHNDIEFCEEEEQLIIRFLKDTAECFISEKMDEVQ